MVRRNKRYNRKTRNRQRAHPQGKSRSTGLPGKSGNTHPMIRIQTTETFDITVWNETHNFLIDPSYGVPTRARIYAVPPRDTDSMPSNVLAMLRFIPHASSFVGSTLVTTALGDYSTILPYNARTKLITTLNFRSWYKNGLQLKQYIDTTTAKGSWYDIGYISLVPDANGTTVSTPVPISIYVVYEFEKDYTTNSNVAITLDGTSVTRGEVTDVNIGKSTLQGGATIMRSKLIGQFNYIKQVNNQNLD